MGLFHQPMNSQHLEQGQTHWMRDKYSFTLDPKSYLRAPLTAQGTRGGICRNRAAHREMQGHSRCQ